MAQLWEYYIHNLIDNEVRGLIIDVRNNPGGNGRLAVEMAGYFFDEEIFLSQEYYYNDNLHEFEASDHPTLILPGPIQFEGPIAVLVSPYCVSACEGFSYALAQQDRAIVVGHAPTAGAFGEVGRGQYSLPEDQILQIPTGRPETPDGELLIEGKGVEPDITVPVTEDSALDLEDAVLNAAIDAVLEKIK
jgi:carboxyl-terminal processing protease